MRRSAGQPWYSNTRMRLRFERGASAAHPSLATSCTGRRTRDTVTYRLTIKVPYYEPRRVRIVLSNGSTPTATSITADGPTDSPHRFKNGSLCVWRDDDPPHLRWVADDGLLALITHVGHHLYFEAYWRETKAAGRPEWLGDEAEHTALRPLNRRARRAR
jgi:hypothetical protein